jgi:hypothetical protein
VGARVGLGGIERPERALDLCRAATSAHDERDAVIARLRSGDPGIEAFRHGTVVDLPRARVGISEGTIVIRNGAPGPQRKTGEERLPACLLRCLAMGGRSEFTDATPRSV